MANKRVHVAIVGAGAGGGVAAQELARAGLTVVLFERGGWPDYDAHINDELISQRTQVLGSAFGPDHRKHPRVRIGADDSRRVVTPIMGGYGHNAACVGSGTVSYGVMAWRFMPEDFRMRSTYGDVEGSTLEDWPLSYEELEPYYEKAEWEIGVAGDDSQNPFAPPRKRPQPMPPFENNREGKVLAAACRRLGLHPFPIPMLRNSVPYNGRPACIRNRTCVGFACPVDGKNGTQNTVIPAAMATGNCEVRTQCQVAEVLTDDRGRVTGVAYFDERGKGQVQPADAVVLAASATETARLMLNSTSRLHPEGLGNRYDWVGRNLQGHAYTGAQAVFEEEITDFAGPGATFGFCDYNHHNEGIVGGGLLCNEFNALPYLYTGIRPPGSPRWGKAHKDFQMRNIKRTAALHGPVQEMPNFHARVTVDPSVKDHWGIPVVALSGERHPLDHEQCRWLSEKAEKVLKEAGAARTWLRVGGRGLSGGQHQAGTARMGNDPQTSVTNRYGQVHGIDNLFVADGSLFVTAGGFNPVLTILALGYWVSDYMIRTWRGTGFKS